ncbi:MAG: YlmC/YmxH family sporulation protein [Clostridia bacterium]|nr:YlmC/YmxH family sporulation protein [Clostridia bacterium]
MNENTNRASSFRHKEVIDISTGDRLGFMTDVDVDLTEGRIKAIIIPGKRRFFGFLPPEEDVVIEWEHIKKIGDDIILVATSGEDY